MKRTKKIKYNFPVLALDPSLTAFGYAVLDGYKVLECGCIKTKPSPKVHKIRKGDDRCRRIQEILNVFFTLFEKYPIKFIISEQPHGSQSASAATSLGIMLGIVETLSVFKGVAVEWYSEQESKRCILYKNEATKAEMIEAVRAKKYTGWFREGDRKKAINEAVADALAVHYVASKNSFVLKTFMK